MLCILSGLILGETSQSGSVPLTNRRTFGDVSPIGPSLACEVRAGLVEKLQACKSKCHKAGCGALKRTLRGPRYAVGCASAHPCSCRSVPLIRKLGSAAPCRWRIFDADRQNHAQFRHENALFPISKQSLEPSPFQYVTGPKFSPKRALSGFPTRQCKPSPHSAPPASVPSFSAFSQPYSRRPLGRRTPAPCDGVGPTGRTM